MTVKHCVSREIVTVQIEQKRSGYRKTVRHGGTLCSKCLTNAPAPKQRYCRPCHASAQAASRAKAKTDKADRQSRILHHLGQAIAAAQHRDGGKTG